MSLPLPFMDMLSGLNAVLPHSLAFLLQSNDALSQGLAGGMHALKPDLTAYGGLTGMFAQVFLIAISFIGGLLHNYGIAIILTCLLVRFMLLPLTRTQVTGMRMMQMLQPVQKEIMRFYPNKQDQNAKIMELYQAYKINPLAGCLPMFIQLPILFGVYRALYDPSFAGKSFFGIQLLFPVELTLPRSYGVGPDLADLIDVTVAQLNLHHQVWHIPANIPLLGGHFIYWPAVGLVVLYVASSLYMQRVMKKVNQPDPDFEREFREEMKSSGEGAADPNDMAKQMQRQMGFMNIMILVFAFFFSAGALIYFIVQNLMMSVEYTLLPRTAPHGFDAREMKAFIRRPPPPIQGAGGAAPPAPPAKPKGDGPKTPPPSANGSPLGEAALEAEVLDTDMLSGPRPQKKRRKR